MTRLATLSASLVGAAAFGWIIPVKGVLDTAPALTTAITIIVAAVLVRLNRGMPTLEWKSMEPVRRRTLTASILAVTREYLGVITLNAVALFSLIGISVGRATILHRWPPTAQHGAFGALGLLLGLCLARIGYVLWRDYDIVRLQKELIDLLAAADSAKQEVDTAGDKLGRMRAAGLRAVPIETREWGN